MKKSDLKKFAVSLTRNEMRSVNGGQKEFDPNTCTCSNIGQACGGSCTGRTCFYSTEMQSYFCKLG